MQNKNPKTQSAQPVTLDETVRRMQLEILHDVVAGHVPRTVGSFGELHDMRDANTYGGFCDDAVAGPLIAAFGGRSVDEALPVGLTDFMNAAQARVDTWLFNGALERESLPSGWSLADDQTQEAYDPWGYKSAKPLYLLKVREKGVPTLDLSVLQDGDSFIGVHGDVKLV